MSAMESMFMGARSFNQPLNDWNVSKVTSIIYMFMYARSFNQPLDNWNVSNVEYMVGMFAFANSFNQRDPVPLRSHRARAAYLYECGSDRLGLLCRESGARRVAPGLAAAREVGRAKDGPDGDKSGADPRARAGVPGAEGACIAVAHVPRSPILRGATRDAADAREDLAPALR